MEVQGLQIINWLMSCKQVVEAMATSLTAEKFVCGQKLKVPNDCVTLI